MRRGLFAVLVLSSLAFAAHADAQVGSKKRRPLPDEYGRVVMGETVPNRRLAPVVFEHWRHRAMFTCRLCHVDLGFAMKASATNVKVADIDQGYYCGACHDGKFKHQGRAVFEACQRGVTGDGCRRCHSYGLEVPRTTEFHTVTGKLPRGRFGNGVNWELAEEQRLIQPIDTLEGVSIKRESITVQRDFALSPKVASMPEIVFSHKKHTVWNGCEGCHPEIFVGVKKGTTKYSMNEIFEGKYCGVCHLNVAFPMIDCQRCHSKPVGAAP